MPAAAAILFLCSLAISAGVTPWVRDVAVRSSALDHAHHSRKVHTRAVPRIGGLGFVAGVYGALALAFLFQPVRDAMLVDRTRLLGLALAGLAIVGLGVWDDLLGTGAKQKLTIQVGAGLLLYFTGHAIHRIDNPFGASIELGPLALPVTLLWIAGVSNAMNLIDGLDGLAGGVGLAGAVVAAALAFHAGNLAQVLVAASLAGGLIGFLAYNVHPASVFMGDTGSLFLGTVLAALALWPHEAGSRDVPLLAMGVALALPIADTLLAMVRRAGRGLPIFSADREHIHHLLLDRGLSHGRAVLVLWGLCALLAGSAIYIASATQWRGLALVVTLAGLALALNRLGLLRGPSPALSERRRANRMRLKVVRDMGVRIRDTNCVACIRDELAALAPAIGAESVRLTLGAEDSPPPLEGGVRSFPIDSSPARRGTLDVLWRDRGAEQDAELALETLSRQLAGTLRRLLQYDHGDLRSAAPDGGKAPVHRFGHLTPAWNVRSGGRLAGQDHVRH